jgi:integrase
MELITRHANTRGEQMNKLQRIENNAVATVARVDLRQVLPELTTKGLDSAHSRTAYHRAVVDFLNWHEENGKPALRLFTLEAYRQTLKDSGKGAANINQRLSAIRRMIRKAAANGLMPEAEARSAASVEGVSAPGHSVGRWISKGQAERFLAALGNPTSKAEKRDFALIALALSSGLRRAEIAALQVEHLQEVDGRPVILGIIGKRNKKRDVPITAWALKAIRGWMDAAGIESGTIFRPVHRGGRVLGSSMTPEAIRQSVERAIGRANQAGANLPRLACHDLRRSFAQLARRGGAPIEQIAKSLGHSSIVTTQIYLGTETDFRNAPADALGLEVACDNENMIV